MRFLRLPSRRDSPKAVRSIVQSKPASANAAINAWRRSSSVSANAPSARMMMACSVIGIGTRQRCNELETWWGRLAPTPPCATRRKVCRKLLAMSHLRRLSRLHCKCAVFLQCSEHCVSLDRRSASRSNLGVRPHCQTAYGTGFKDARNSVAKATQPPLTCRNWHALTNVCFRHTRAQHNTRSRLPRRTRLQTYNVDDQRTPFRRAHPADLQCFHGGRSVFHDHRCRCNDCHRGSACLLSLAL